ncbi:LacI family DNA-binding transcriptional regulator [Belliella pelovolcani]|uniref:Transcriptional regulator, LacI family n=1 Tax=Belliella pelovolcani TaxID=529505 RepID=A0A1N7LW18_9BACT|nr:LacI family DNA-binding transcriptional regulator [Belliella pelovolcani]SIS78016.1 transcriptional regulator, LacI family [Belliella pelovolcani]
MTDKKKLTLKDIGKALNLSVSTVSRALKAHPDIAQETIDLVKKYAEEHHYVPNLLAINFRKNRTFNIGLIVPELVHHFFSTVISGAISEANKQGYNILVSQSNDILKDEEKASRAMLNSSVDGLLISISNETTVGEHLKEFLDEGKAVVQFDKVTEQLPTPMVIVDDFDGAYNAVSHLIEQGYQRIAHIRGRIDVKNACDRYEGYIKALEDASLPILDHLIKPCIAITEEEGYQFTKEMMEGKNPPDAIFCITDVVAFGAMKYLKEKGIAIPEEVGLVGFSNWMVSRVMSPQLTTVNQHGFQMGVEAAKLLLDMIKNQDIAYQETKILKTELIVRASSQKK